MEDLAELDQMVVSYEEALREVRSLELRLNIHFTNVLDVYLTASARTRRKMRSRYAQHPPAVQDLFRYWHSQLEDLNANGDTRNLVRALAAISLNDFATDFRDCIQDLARLYQGAAAKGLEPEEHFRRVAAISSERVAKAMSDFDSLVSWDLDYGRRLVDAMKAPKTDALPGYKQCNLCGVVLPIGEGEWDTHLKDEHGI